jgi:transposase
MDGKALKEKIGEARRASKRVPEALQDLVVRYVEQQQIAGVSMKEIGSELGMSFHTLSYWRARSSQPRSTSLARVKVVEPKRTEHVVVVHAPSGLRIEGLSMTQLAELIGRLR